MSTNDAVLTTTTSVGAARLAAQLDLLPPYFEVKVTYVRGGDGHVHHLMARDIPRPGRRWTSLTSGFEVFNLGDYFATLLDMTDHGEFVLDILPVKVTL